jgi:hypothetical protein
MIYNDQWCTNLDYMPLWIKVPSQESFGASFGESAWRLAVSGIIVGGDWFFARDLARQGLHIDCQGSILIDAYPGDPSQRGLRHWVAATGNASGESTSGADSPWHGWKSPWSDGLVPWLPGVLSDCHVFSLLSSGEAARSCKKSSDSAHLVPKLQGETIWKLHRNAALGPGLIAADGSGTRPSPSGTWGTWLVKLSHPASEAVWRNAWNHPLLEFQRLLWEFNGFLGGPCWYLLSLGPTPSKPKSRRHSNDIKPRMMLGD